MKTAFLFDMAGVLLDFDLESIQQRVAKDSCLTVEEVVQGWKNHKYVQSESGEIKSESYFYHYSDEIALTWSYEQWIDEWSAICTINRNGSALFHHLIDHGYRAGILSNLAEYHKIAVERKFPDFWTHSFVNILSYEIGMQKPNPELYLLACNQMGIFPGDCIYFDDTAEYIPFAESIGLRAYHFTEGAFLKLPSWLEQQQVFIDIDKV